MKRLFGTVKTFARRQYTLPHSRFFSSTPRKMSLEDLTDSQIKGKNVLIRVDFNVPLNKETGEITDDTRIRSALPSINHLKDKGARVIIATHLGRPKGKAVDGMRMAPVSKQLASLLGDDVAQAGDCVGEGVEEMVGQMSDGQVLCLENVRFHKGETQNDMNFAKQLVDVTKAEVYVNDAFGTAHRAHASTAGVVDFIRGPHVCGYLMEKELSYLKNAVDSPTRPFAAIVGGSKVSTKIKVLESLLDKTDKMIIGGAMIFTFYRARGLSVGASMVEEEALDVAKAIEAKAREKGVELILPPDVVIADKFAEDADWKVCSVDSIPDGWMGLDVGPQFCASVFQAVQECKTVLWNGPMGVCEWDTFKTGTVQVAEAMAAATQSGAVTIVGGGDSVAAVEAAGLADQMSHISTGGGASLELLEGKELPGVKCLDDFAEPELEQGEDA